MSIKILRFKEVIALTGLSRSSIYRLIEGGDFPLPRRLSARAIGFQANDIEAWISARESWSPTESASEGQPNEWP